MLWQGTGNLWQLVFFEGGSGGIGNFTQDYFDNRWTPDNPNASGPRIYDRESTSTASANTYFLHNSSYMRLKNLVLSYSLPGNIISKLSVADCRIFVSGYNLLTITGIKDVDPEETASNQNFAAWNNKQSKIFNAGFNVTF